jgi:Protein of unknown function (DUF3592)
MIQRRMTFLLFYVLAAAAIAVLAGRPHWMDHYRLASAGVVTEAQVTETNCADHSTFSYRFTVEGHNIDGSGDAGYGNPPCGALKPGDRVQVAYLPSTPQSNLPGDPKERLANETIGIALAALFLPLVFLLILFLFLRLRQKGEGRRTS